MEPRDLVKVKSQLKKEFEEIERTTFWREYVARLEDERRIASRHCETDSLDDVPKYQGKVDAIDAIRGLPLKVLEVSPRKIQ